MKNLIYLLLFLIVGNLNAQVISFADNDFKLKLLEADVTNNIAKTLGGNNIKIDADNNGQITVQEVALVYELFIPNETTINSIEEIIYFVNLTKLDAQSCAISGIVNLSNLTFLERIYLNNNQINEIDIVGCVAMKEIVCNNNLIQKMDVATLINLEVLNVDNNPIFQIFAKNGANETISFNGVLNQSLNYICADEIQVSSLQGQVTNGCVVNSLCTNTPGGNFNTITGTLYFDAAGNGLDVSDLPHPYVKLKSILGNDDSTILQTVTQQNATYTFATTEIGGFDVLPSVENQDWFTITPVAGNFLNANNNVFNQDFLLAPIGVHSDVEVMIRPMSQVTPGSNASYEIVFKNKGNQLHNGFVTFGYDESVLDFVSSTASLVNSGVGQLSLAYSNLLPFETRSFQIVLNINSSVNNNDVLNYTVSIDPNNEDLTTQGDNSVVYRQNVQSVIPNRMKCIEGDLVPDSEIGKYLHYVINFENTGNQVARNVVISTDFDVAQYDINSIQILNATNALSVNAQNQNVKFNLNNAYVGGPGGQGGILLKIKTKSNLPTGSTVNARAEVFFDYDAIQVAPLVSITQLVETTFQALSVPENTIDKSVKLYPNPTSSNLNIEADSPIQVIQLFDIYGRLLQTNLLESVSTNIDLSQRAAGIYFIKVTTDKGQKTEKIIRN
ncbi:T9SS type A sorting domain-containing protein [Flavobacterium sp.]|uniref:DUF7619 domain-containing protein n=1 Tax=Flavobacterium sp. TaxID=239 RepID=UPI00391C574A